MDYKLPKNTKKEWLDRLNVEGSLTSSCTVSDLDARTLYQLGCENLQCADCFFFSDNIKAMLEGEDK